MRFGLFGSTAMAVSFCDAAAVSLFTVTAGAATEVPSSGLERTCPGVIAAVAVAAVSSPAPCPVHPEKRVWGAAVPVPDGTLPAGGVRWERGWSWVGVL